MVTLLLLRLLFKRQRFAPIHTAPAKMLGFHLFGEAVVFVDVRVFGIAIQTSVIAITFTIIILVELLVLLLILQLDQQFKTLMFLFFRSLKVLCILLVPVLNLELSIAFCSCRQSLHAVRSSI